MEREMLVEKPAQTVLLHRSLPGIIRFVLIPPARRPVGTDVVETVCCAGNNGGRWASKKGGQRNSIS